jgi:Immunity protein Imm5
METYYKVLGADGVSPYHGGSGKWFVPKGKRAGKWMPAITNIEPCARGYHFITLAQLPQWIGPTLYEVEVRGAIIHQSDKSVAEQARLIRRVQTWNDKTRRLFAADCAEHVLELYEKRYPNDNRPRAALQAARDFASGKITLNELNAAANAAAAAAAAYAAYYAANAAAAAAAYYAANAAAADAAANAAAERQWQLERLKFYLEI